MRKSLFRCVSLIVVAVFVAGRATAQENKPAATLVRPNAVPGLITYNGILKDARGQTRASVAGVTFLLYRDEQGGAPLWVETQNVVPDKSGHYTVQLGATTANGISATVFQTGEARWLAVQIAGEAEQARIMLVAVPYAMKAVDAETLGGLPASAFVLAAPPSGEASSAANEAAPSANPQAVPPAGAVTGAGTANYVPLWTGATTVGNSVLYQTGSGSTARIGINTTTPGVTLDVKGAATIRGTLALPAPAAATASAGKNSQPLNLTASAFNSGTATAVGQTFRWQAEPAGNNTSTATGTLNLLFGVGASTPAETGLKIANNGQITFSAGQTFPGTGAGTITGVTAGTDLTGGGTSGAVTLNLDTTKVPQLVAANTFTGNQTVNGNLSATGVVTGSSYQIGGARFAFGIPEVGNAFLGFAGNATTTGAYDTAAGVGALYANTGGTYNTAVGASALGLNSNGNANTASGWEAMQTNSTGSNNTAIGVFALDQSDTGSNNTGLGYETGSTMDFSTTTGCCNTFLGAYSAASTGTLTNATAVGAYSVVGASNSLVLGSINGVNTATASTNVGIGTTAPLFTLDIHGGMLHVGGNVPKTHSVQGAYLDWNALTGTTGETDLINNLGGGIGGFAFMNTPSSGTPLSTLMFITGAGRVGIGTTSPDNTLTVNGSADKPGGGSWAVYSDARLKTLHGNYTAGLSQIMKLHPIRYRYKEQNGMNISDRDEHVGFVAQDVQRVIPEAVTQNSSGYLLVNNDPILWTMLNAIQQQQAEIRSLRAQLHRPTEVWNARTGVDTPARIAPSTGKSGNDQELRRVRAELDRLKKKDAGLESRLARLEQAVSGLPAAAPASASISSSVDGGAAHPGK